ncbi:MAG TPA: glycosyltransferase family 2 protein [bacterium]|nr:glycosyltransferase family 2 protein [bacterium]
MNEKRSTRVSVLIPLYNEEENLEPLVGRLRPVLDSLGADWEVIFVDDGSTDGSFERLRRLRDGCPGLKAVRFRRNFWKSAALRAGFRQARGDRVVIMDADLQDDPEEIPGLLELLDQGYDLVGGWRADRRDRFVKRQTSRIYNLATSTLTGIRIHDFNCGLKAFRREVIESIPVHGELHRYIPVLAHRRGFRVTEKKVRHHPRLHGESKFGPYRFFAGFADLVTVLFLTRYFKKPLHFFGGLGLMFFVAGFAIDFVLLVGSLFGETIRTRPLLFLGILLMLIGFQFISTGLLGEMLAMGRDEDEREYLVGETLE